MTIKELIERLREYPEEMPVYGQYYYSSGDRGCDIASNIEYVDTHENKAKQRAVKLVLGYEE